MVPEILRHLFFRSTLDILHTYDSKSLKARNTEFHGITQKFIHCANTGTRNFCIEMDTTVNTLIT
jgi:hypothetical protein